VNEVLILTGEIHSGKTTRLIDWSHRTSNATGVATPVIRGKRMFFDLSTGETFLMEAIESDKKTIAVGKYIFNEFAFEKAIRILENAISSSAGYVIIDEIGPLELNGKGFSKILKKILSNDKRNYDLVLVIRKSILKMATEYFHIKNYRLFDL
jgi:nucleoside-triphosphatase